MEKSLNVLILGGTTEASRLAAALAERPDVRPLLSLAGRTEAPRSSPIPARVGGFGGIEGLTRFLVAAKISAVVDATHPFAARISSNAVAACRRARVPLLAYTRPAWAAEADDRWTVVADVGATALALGEQPKTVFLTIGRQEVAAFQRAPQHRYLIRTIDRPDPGHLPPRHEVLQDRGPFDVARELQLMRSRRIDVLVTKNSGGSAAAAKLEAARLLGLPVLMVERPTIPERPSTHDLEAVLAWIDAQRPAP